MFSCLFNPAVGNQFRGLARLLPCLVHLPHVNPSDVSPLCLAGFTFCMLLLTCLQDLAAHPRHNFLAQTPNFRSFWSEILNNERRKKMELFWCLQFQNFFSRLDIITGPWDMRAFSSPYFHSYLCRGLCRGSTKFFGYSWHTGLIFISKGIWFRINYEQLMKEKHQSWLFHVSLPVWRLKQNVEILVLLSL